MRTMKVRERNLRDIGSGATSLKPVFANRFIKNGYTHILYKGKQYSCGKVGFDLIPNENVWVNGLVA